MKYAISVWYFDITEYKSNQTVFFFLERVKRRCKVKESKAVLEKINKVAGHDMVAPFNMQGNNMYEPRNKNVQCIPYPLYMGVPVQGDQSVPQYPNLVPSLDHCVGKWAYQLQSLLVYL